MGISDYIKDKTIIFPSGREDGSFLALLFGIPSLLLFVSKLLPEPNTVVTGLTLQN